MLICLLCEMVIQINPVVVADESNHFVLANYYTDAQKHAGAIDYSKLGVAQQDSRYNQCQVARIV